MIAVLTSVVALAIGAGDPPEWTTQAITDLGSDRLDQREAASLRLLESPQLELTDIEEMLREPGLSPEQRIRLMLVAELRFRSTARAAVGIQLGGPRDGPPSVTNLVQGFDAREKLAVGDTILVIAGEPIDSLDRLRTVIIAHDPGDTVGMKVSREGVEVEVEVRLGRFDNLGNAQIRESELDEAWAFRLLRREIASGGPVFPSGVLPGQWETLQPQGRGISDRLVVVGGVAREQPGRYDGVLLNGTLEGDVEAKRRELREGLSSELEQLNLSIARVRRTVELQQSALKRRDLAPDRRDQLEDALETNRSHLESYELRRDRLVSLLRTLRGD